jgi:hypothetical protein
MTDTSGLSIAADNVLPKATDAVTGTGITTSLNWGTRANPNQRYTVPTTAYVKPAIASVCGRSKNTLF